MAWVEQVGQHSWRMRYRTHDGYGSVSLVQLRSRPVPGVLVADLEKLPNDGLPALDGLLGQSAPASCCLAQPSSIASTTASSSCSSVTPLTSSSRAVLSHRLRGMVRAMSCGTSEAGTARPPFVSLIMRQPVKSLSRVRQATDRRSGSAGPPMAPASSPKAEVHDRDHRRDTQNLVEVAGGSVRRPDVRLT